MSDLIADADFAVLSELAGLEWPGEFPAPLARRRALDDAGLTWLAPPVVSTPAARRHARAWIAQYGLRAPDDPPARRAAAEELAILGEVQLTHLAREVLARHAPVPLLHHGRRAFFVVLGHAIGGFRDELPALDAHRTVIGCAWPGSPDEFARLLTHEVVHEWLLPTPAVRRAATAIRTERQVRLAAAASLGFTFVDRLAAEMVHQERQCYALLAWLGFSTADLEAGERRARLDVHEAARLEVARQQAETDDLEAAVADVADDPDEARA